MSIPEHLKTCEVTDCGREAFVATRDLQEVEPVLDVQGGGKAVLWTRYEASGPWHPRCNEHPRRAETFDSQGRVVVQVPVEA